MVQGYVQDAPGRLGRLKAALVAGDRNMLGRQAHDLKSNSATIGATALSSLAARIEQEAEAASSGDLEAWIQAAEAMLPQVLAALDEKVRQYPG
jgi:HPt (histidine-containing phosphotransfer) domain-containing protein